jgi:hypothetical protein
MQNTEENAMKILTTATVLATVLMTGSAFADSRSTKCWADAGWGTGYWVKCDGASQYTVAPVRARIPPPPPTWPVPRDQNGADIGAGGGGGGGGGRGGGNGR